MKRLPLFAILLAAFFAAPFSSVRDANAEELMPPQFATQLGLEQVWLRQLRVPAGEQSLVDQQLYVHLQNLHEYVEVLADGKEKPKTGEEVLLRISIDRIGKNGLPIGKKEAERLAKNEIRRLEYIGKSGKLSSRTVPRVRLYSLSDDGTLECRDAESGEPIWMTRVGNRSLGYGKIGVDDKYVTVVNGANLIQIDATNGKTIESVRTVNTPLYGAIHSGQYSLLPTIRNGVDGYSMQNPKESPFQESVDGLALAPPMKSPSSTRVAWGTSKGFVYFMELSGTPSVLFRLNTDGIVSGRLAATKGDNFFFGSENGQVYSVKATRTGRVNWSQPYGEPFYNDPMVIGDQLLLRSTYGNLYCLNVDSGIMDWTYVVPNIDELMGAFGGHVFVKLLSGGMGAIDLKSGKVTHTFNSLTPGRMLVNNQTNRLYLVGKTGAVQCLRPIDAMLPTLNDPVMGTPMKEVAKKEPEMEKKEPTPAGDGGFGEKDPFAAGGDDPFGAAGGDAMEDPFGAAAGDGDDPFADPFGN